MSGTARTSAPSLQPLRGYRVVSLALNVPGPAAAARLRQLGAGVTKIEPPTGDALAQACPTWYDALTSGQTVVRLDLKVPADRARLETMLAEADLLLTAQRPGALARLGLDWPAVQQRFPQLCHVAIVSDTGAAAETPGHDLTYMAAHGLLEPPSLPRTLASDLLGAEQAVSAALTLALTHWRRAAAGDTEGASHSRAAGPRRIEVPLAGAAATLAAPLRHGLTAPGGLLGGGLPGYNIYPAADGWVAVAALEPHFWSRLLDVLDLGTDRTSASWLASVFRTRTAADWATWAADHGLPIAAVQLDAEGGHRPDPAWRG